MPSHTNTMRQGLAASLALLILPLAATGTENEPDVGFVVTPDPVVATMLEMAEVEPGELVVDLGSGDGRIPIAAARDHGAIGWGVEIDRRLVERSRDLARDAGVADRVHFTHADLFETDFSDADVVALYLLPELNLRLRPHILAMQPGTRVVSHEFDMGDWQPDRRERVGGHPLYLWMVPGRVEGEWMINDGETRLHLSIKQRFQRFEGRASWSDGDAPIRDARLNGGEFSFSLRLDEKWLAFRGKASRDGIERLESSPALSGFRPVTSWAVSAADGDKP